MDRKKEPRTSVVLLNWEEFDTALYSLQKLLTDQEKGENLEIIFIDNGSENFGDYVNILEDMLKVSRIDSEDELVGLDGNVLCPLHENMGPSVGRNVGIDLSYGKRIFLIDGDIQYVPGTLKVYNEIFDFMEADLKKVGDRLGCVGYNDYDRVCQYGYNGTEILEESDPQMRLDYTLELNTPIAWTQYGLFDGELLREIRFIEEGPFGEAGHGYEDDWLYHEFEQRNIPCVSLNRPLYYHQKNMGLINLKKHGVSDKGNERREMFYNKWGNTGFIQRMRTGFPRIVIGNIHE